MKITPRMIATIQIALTDKGINQAELSRRVGFHRSHMSNLLKGKVETIEEEKIDLINDVLGTDLAPLVFEQGEVSPLALQVTRLSENDQNFAELLERLIRINGPTIPIEPFLPQVDTSKLEKVGAEITRIVHEWEEASDPHYSKIAAETLDYLRRFYGKM